MSQKNLMSFLSLIVLLSVTSTLFYSSATAQDEPALIIEIYDSNDWNESSGVVFFEGRTYDIMVSTENETVVLNVNITLLGVTYMTNVTEPFITVTAPFFNDTESFVINASKAGYRSAEVEITVMKGELSVSADRGTIEENKEFQVIVKDQNNKPVTDASVFIIQDAIPVLTDNQGVAYVRAPEVTIITTTAIQVVKAGYLPGSTNIRVENAEALIFGFSESLFLQMLPILLAVIVVIFAIVYVLWRQRRNPAIPPQTVLKKQSEVPSTPRQEHHKPRSREEPVMFPEKRDVPVSNPVSRVEEIRIPVQAKKKETTILPEEESDHEPVPEHLRKEQEEWFKGQDYMRYKLDELTGTIDQKTDGKWFEGEHDSKSKVDETLRKSFKKKKNNEDDVRE